MGTAYTTVNADALARWHRLLGDDVWFMTGTDEHGAKIVEAAEANGTTPKEWTDRTSARFVEAWERLDISNDDFIRTTEPRHYAVVQQFLQRIYDNGFIELGSYSGLYCVSCEDYYTEDQLVDGKCPVHGRPVIEMQEDNYFFKLSQFEQRLLDYYDSHPDFVRPTSKRNEALGFIRGGLRDVSITRTSFTWGVPVPVGQRARLLRLVRRAHQLPDGGRLRRRPRHVRGPLGRGPPPDRQGHPQVPLRLVARHVHGGRHRAAGGDLRARLPADGRPEARQDDDRVRAGGRRGRRAAQRSPTCRRWRWPTTSGSTRCATTCCATWPLGGDGDFSYEGIVARYNADLANNLGNLVSRVTTVVTPSAAASAPAAMPASELARRGGRRARGGDGGLGPLGAARRAGGDLAAHRGGQRGARVGRALEDGARAGGRRRPRRRPRGPAHRGRPDRAGHAVDRGRGVAPDRPGGRPLDGPGARGRRVGRLHAAACAVVKGDPLFPRRKA